MLKKAKKRFYPVKKEYKSSYLDQKTSLYRHVFLSFSKPKACLILFMLRTISKADLKKKGLGFEKEEHKETGYTTKTQQKRVKNEPKAQKE